MFLVTWVFVITALNPTGDIVIYKQYGYDTKEECLQNITADKILMKGYSFDCNAFIINYTPTHTLVKK